MSLISASVSHVAPPSSWRRIVRSLRELIALLLLQSIIITQPLAAEALRLSVSTTPLSLPIYVAEKQGYFSAEGLTIRLIDVIGGHRSLQQVFDGHADLATASEAVVMFNSFQRNDYAIIATFVSSDDDIKFITRGDAVIASARDLAGKRVGTVVGSASHYFLDTLLLLNGVDPRTIQIRGLQPEAMAEALKNGDVDGVAVWEPFAFNILNSAPGVGLLPKSSAYVETFNLIAKRSLCGTQDEELTKLLRALERAQQFIRTEPAKAQAILRDRLQVEQAFVDWIWPRYSYRLTLNQSLLTTLESEARWARQEGHVKAGKSPNYLDFIDLAPLRKVRPAGVSID